MPYLICRRALLAGSLVLLNVAASASTQSKIPEATLLASQALPDVVQGKADAPITMVEYASMTCTHCAHFHATVYPLLLKDYVDTGKVKFILREFPLDPLATAAFMVARCSGNRRTAVVDLLFDTQASWAFVDKPLEALGGMMKQTGMSRGAFDTCLKDQTLYENVLAVRDRAAQVFDVTATPTFFVNGVKITGEVTPATLGKVLDPILSQKS